MKGDWKEDPKSVYFPCIKVVQPIGEFYVGSIDHKTLCEITWFDIRRILQERELLTYLGIQRPLSESRVKELREYVKTVDACFPTAVILAVPAVCATYDETTRILTLSNYVDVEDGEDRVYYREIAKVIDGQHRIEGLREYTDGEFQVNVSVFVDIDVAEQAYIFSTVNLAQTKVSKSLVYDLFDLAKARSPQKVCHNIAVALDAHEESPFYQRIKRLGIATEGRTGETLTQATFVEALIQYMSKDKITQLQDRDLYKRGKTPAKAAPEESRKLIFRNMLIDEKDLQITDVLWNYFEAVENRWPDAWAAPVGSGIMLNKNNGFKALMRFLRHAYLALTDPGGVPKRDEFEGIFRKVDVATDHFTTEIYKPGSSGELQLYRMLVDSTDLASVE